MILNNELDGLLVVSLEQAVAAPYCGLLLADAGARVIKVERPDGDFARGYDSGAKGKSTIFAWLNRGKESICLDLKNSDDLSLMRDLLFKADVFVSNLAPGAVNRMGLDGETLRHLNPKLISCRVSGYGETGEAAEMKAYDFLVQAESGVCSVTGTEETPSRVGVSMTDLSSGLTAFSAILRALIQVGKTGQGVDISISMFDVMADWMNMALLSHRYMGGAPNRTGLQHSFIAPYGAFTCGDGTQILLSIQSNREWAAFCDHVLKDLKLIDDYRFVNNTDRFKNRVELDARVNSCFSQYDKAAVISLLKKARIAYSSLNSVSDLSTHPFLKTSHAQIGGEQIELASLPVTTASGSLEKVPDLGEHSDLIRDEFTALFRDK